MCVLGNAGWSPGKLGYALCALRALGEKYPFPTVNKGEKEWFSQSPQRRPKSQSRWREHTIQTAMPIENCSQLMMVIKDSQCGRRIKPSLQRGNLYEGNLRVSMRLRPIFRRKRGGESFDALLDSLRRQPGKTEARLLTDDAVGVKILSAGEADATGASQLRPLLRIHPSMDPAPEI
jgi:hypothetical protein